MSIRSDPLKTRSCPGGLTISPTTNGLSMVTPVKKVPIHLQSSQNRLLIKNGTIVNGDGEQLADVFIEGNLIKQIGVNMIIPGGTRAIDAQGKYVIPGGIDANTHFQAPANNTQTIDGFYQGTKAALVGGTTCVIDVVKPGADESLIDAYNKWRGWADPKVCCDFGLKMTLEGKKLDESTRREMVELTKPDFGVSAFVLPMSGDAAMDDEQLMDAFQECAKIGALAQVVPESGEVVARLEKQMIEKGVTGPEGFALSHPEYGEEEATMRASTLADEVGCPLYVSAVMGGAAADVVRRKKARGNVLFAETVAAAIGCNGQDYWNRCWRHAAGFVCRPPIRKDSWQLVTSALSAGSGGLDLVASNHATFTGAQKALGRADFRKIPVGVNGVAARLSVLWEKAVHSGLMSPARFVETVSAAPAKIFGLYPDKGRIGVGSDADIVVWDPAQTTTLSAENHPIKVDFNIFEGMECHGVADTVICQGRIMVDEGHVRVMQGFGKHVPLSNFTPYVYEAVKARSAARDAVSPVARSEADMAVTNGLHAAASGGEIPGPPEAIPTDAQPAASQHASHFDVAGDHPNPPDAAEPMSLPPVNTSVDNFGVRSSPLRSSVRVRAPPGGSTSGSFW